MNLGWVFPAQDERMSMSDTKSMNNQLVLAVYSIWNMLLLCNLLSVSTLHNRCQHELMCVFIRKLFPKSIVTKHIFCTHVSVPTWRSSPPVAARRGVVHPRSV